MSSLVQIWRPANISAGPTADATTRALISRHGPTFRVPVEDTGTLIQASVGATTVYPVAAVKTENFFFFDTSMVIVTVHSQIGPPDSNEILRLGRIEATKPVINSINPASVQANSTGNSYMAFEINGTGFVPGMWLMQYGSYAGVCYYNSPTQLIATVSQQDFPDVRSYQVTYPGDSGYVFASNSKTLTFVAEVTQTGVGINNVSRVAFEYGMHETMLIYGFGFSAGTIPYLDGTMLLDNVVVDSATQMTTRIPVNAPVGARKLTVKYNSGANSTRDLYIGITTEDMG